MQTIDSESMGKIAFVLFEFADPNNVSGALPFVLRQSVYFVTRWK